MQNSDSCIAIDIGNTRAKAALFKGSEIIRRWTFDPVLEDDWSGFAQEIPEEIPLILSSVRPLSQEFLLALESKAELIILDGSTPVPFQSMYQTPGTLGPDRIALVAGAMALYPGETLLIVDAGTCITCDLLVDGIRYEGGSISPGLDLRFRSLNEFTGALPLVKKEEGTYFPGKTTRESILSGVCEGAAEEIRGRFSSLADKYPGIMLLLTGGDARYFVKNLKNSIFASPELVLQGLRTILDHYVRKSH